MLSHVKIMSLCHSCILLFILCCILLSAVTYKTENPPFFHKSFVLVWYVTTVKEILIVIEIKTTTTITTLKYILYLIYSNLRLSKNLHWCYCCYIYLSFPYYDFYGVNINFAENIDDFALFFHPISILLTCMKSLVDPR